MSYIAEIRPLIGQRVLPLPGVAICVHDTGGRFLLVRVEGPQGEYWVWPGGMVEVGETVAEAAIRECVEETGFSVELRRLIGVYSGPQYRVTYRNGDQVDFTAVFFEAAIVGEEGDIRDVDEIRGKVFFPLEQIALLPMPEIQRKMAFDAALNRTDALWM